MHLSIPLLSCVGMAILAQAAPYVDYGPCDYNGNDNCREIMENTACFLNPTSAEQIFKCISGGASGVCACYGCLGYQPVGDILSQSSACVGVPTAVLAPAPDATVPAVAAHRTDV
ncbi:hypothetical protein B0H66DRAFT_538103 [Apodospora peruviana]|uniref:Uncharacterized protein n=1 Tax=Apodospora peruviana TaxID=516989 RepID=A0AAE0HU91_9PEZI|nr:hypothetical protein B0H66DRAFT_538103 [Apodospora peruviana]